MFANKFRILLPYKPCKIQTVVTEHPPVGRKGPSHVSSTLIVSLGRLWFQALSCHSDSGNWPGGEAGCSANHAAGKSPRYCLRKTSFFMQGSGNFSDVQVKCTPFENLKSIVEKKCGCRFLAEAGHSAFLRHFGPPGQPRRVLPTSFTVNVTSKLARGDWGRGCIVSFVAG